MFWKSDARSVSLVINPAPFEEGTGYHRRQKYCMDVLTESAPEWVNVEFCDLRADLKKGRGFGLSEHVLVEDSEELLGQSPPLPMVREMMEVAEQFPAEWIGVSIADVIFTYSAWEPFQTTDANVIVCRASQVPDVDEGERVVYTPLKKPNELSMDALFVRGPAVKQFFDDFPDVVLSEYWDDAATVWCRRHRRIGVQVLNNHETMHRMHDATWSKGVTFGHGDMASGLRPVAIYNRAKIGEFRAQKRR